MATDTDEQTLRDAALKDLRDIRALADAALHRTLTLDEAEAALDGIHEIACRDGQDDEPDDDEDDDE